MTTIERTATASTRDLAARLLEIREAIGYQVATADIVDAEAAGIIEELESRNTDLALDAIRAWERVPAGQG